MLGTQEITAAKDGSFSTMVPGSVTRSLPRSDEPLSLALRAVDASYDDYAAADAGAGSVTLAAEATDLLVENSFVSSVGWVKPGESYPSRIIVTNPGTLPVAGATVTVTAPARDLLRQRQRARAPRPSPPTRSPGRSRPSPAATGSPWSSRTRADTTTEEPTIVWRDLSTTAVLDTLTGDDRPSSATAPR